jgi:hypothetical protein
MSSPKLVSETLGGEDVVAQVPLRDDDALFVSPTKTLQYHGQSLLSNESVEEFPHTAERLAISSGRRKTAFELDYGLEGTRKLTIPSNRTDVALHPILAGVLAAAGVTESGETVRETFRFSELTLVVTDNRLIKHVGQAVWDEEYEEFSFAGVCEFVVEEGRVATQFVLTISGRAERIKIPNERARAFRECLEDALCSHHEIESIADLPDPDSTVETKPADETPFEPASVEASDSSEESAPLYELGERDGEPTSLERLDALENALDTHLELLDEQYRELDQLRTELTRDR